MENVILSGIFLIMLLIIFWQIGEIKKHQEITVDVLEAINESIGIFNEFAEQSNQKEINTIQALQDICTALNTAFQNEQRFINHSSTALHNIIFCMILFIDDIRERAIEEEDYERAQECNKIIFNFKQLINEK